MHKVRCETFENKVCAVSGIYKAIRDGIQVDSEKILANTLSNLTNSMKILFEKIQHDFDSVNKTNQDDSLEAKEFRKKLHAMIPEAKKVLAGPVKDLLEECRNFR